MYPDDPFSLQTVRCVLEERKDAEFTEEQYKMLLTYVESDICDVERQIVAFALLGTIVGKGINLPELHSLMKKGLHLWDLFGHETDLQYSDCYRF